MAQRIIGLDLGSYALKAVHVESTFRGFQLVGYRERRVAADATDDEGTPIGDREAIEAWLADEPAPPETIICAMPGDVVLTRFLTLPFKDRKRISEVIGFELETHIPYDIDEVVYDYQIVEQTDEETHLLAVAVPREKLDAHLKTLKAAGVDPKVVSFGPWSFLNLAPYLPPTDGPVAIVDIGHRRTDVCVVRGGRIEFARTLTLAGAHLNEVIAKQLGVDVHEADLHKRRDGHLPDGDATRPLPAPTPGLLSGEDAGEDAGGDDDERLADALDRGMDDIARELTRAFYAREAQVETPVERVYLCGGTSRLPGVHRFLEKHLGVPVEQLDVAGFEFNRMADPRDGAEVIPKGLAMSLRGMGTGAVSDVNLRRGPYAYEGEFRFLRDKLTAILLMVLALLSIAGFRAYTRYQSLETQRQQQVAELTTITEDLFGKKIDSFDVALAKLKAAPGEFEPPFPEVDAFSLFFDITTILDEINKTERVPSEPLEDETSGDAKDKEGADKGADADKSADADKAEKSGDTEQDQRPPDDRYIIELETVRIEKATGTLKGQANDIEAYELFLEALKKQRCLKKVETQNTDIVTFKRHTGWRQFQLKFTIDCTARKKPKGSRKAPDEQAGAAVTSESGDEKKTRGSEK